MPTCVRPAPPLVQLSTCLSHSSDTIAGSPVQGILPPDGRSRSRRSARKLLSQFPSISLFAIERSHSMCYKLCSRGNGHPLIAADVAADVRSGWRTGCRVGCMLPACKGPGMNVQPLAKLVCAFQAIVFSLRRASRLRPGDFVGCSRNDNFVPNYSLQLSYGISHYYR